MIDTAHICCMLGVNAYIVIDKAVMCAQTSKGADIYKTIDYTLIKMHY